MSKEKKKTFQELTLQDLLHLIVNVKVAHLISLVIVVLSVWSVYYFKETAIHKQPVELPEQDCPVQKNNKLKYKVYAKEQNPFYLKHVFDILNKLGYEQNNDVNSTDYSLLWAHDYPFRTMQAEIQKLQPHQKINHFPGCGYITNKVDLATTNVKYIPKSFKLPQEKDEFLKYAEENPHKMFVQKSNGHRNIEIKQKHEIDFDNKDTFIQEFIHNPFLVDGYKFDIGVYVIITSVDPLRVYMFNGDILFRYCLHEYYPFDSNDVDKYVVGDKYRPTWEVPSLKYYHEKLGLTMRNCFDTYVRSQGKDPKKMWLDIEDSIRTVILNKEAVIADVVNKFKSKQKFFEMMRFDFIVDEELNVYLMEANMSPNLSSAKYAPNRLLYEQVLLSLFSVVGLSGRFVIPEKSLVFDGSLSVFPEICASDCSDCVSPDCQLCLTCVSEEDKSQLARAYLEHVNRRDCKRVFPPSGLKHGDLEKHVENLSAENQFMYRWFYGKCLLDESWC